MMDIQETKKDLADLLLSGNHYSESDASTRRFQVRLQLIIVSLL